MIYFQMLLGHLVGDYLLQNDFLALNKSKYNWLGWITATIHCILYTFAVCLVMWNFDLIWMIVVFLSHFLIDKFGIAEWYLTHIKGRGLKKFIKSVDEPFFDGEYVKVDYLNYSKGMQIIRGGFTAVVYTITDNTMHLVLMYVAYQLIYF